MKFKLIFLIFVFNMFAVNHGVAFFFHNDRPDNLRIEHTPIDQSTQVNNRAYLYDNFFSGSSETHLTQKRKNFIFIDEIKINVPMNMLIQDSIYPDNSIDRMMLANLRAKKLFDEYTDLQKKARLVIQDHMVPGEKKDETKDSVSMDGNSSIDEKNEAIQKIMSHVNVLGLHIKGIESEQNPLALKHLSSVNDELNTSTENFSDSVSTGKIENAERPISTGPQVLSKTNHRDLPWILNGLLKLLNYIVSNRLEIMLYLIFITMIVFLTALKIRK
ncbi:MAG: hypothetical protein A3J80_13705 [Desulfobacula sp. RIFOXYB2_FULL_45_6]|nr:MAG: hypothetical protein A3J80_13705 [Desulfobacula sp. RIFOXYB2_FULL_45_6]